MSIWCIDSYFIQWVLIVTTINLFWCSDMAGGSSFKLAPVAFWLSLSFLDHSLISGTRCSRLTLPHQPEPWAQPVHWVPPCFFLVGSDIRTQDLEVWCAQGHWGVIACVQSGQAGENSHFTSLPDATLDVRLLSLALGTPAPDKINTFTPLLNSITPINLF